MNENQIISCEDHLIMLLWERKLLQDGLSKEELSIELNNLAGVLEKHRLINNSRCLNFSEKALKYNIELAFNGLIEKQHVKTILKIENIIQHQLVIDSTRKRK